jgi:flagellar hook-associated protein 3 FlgL
MAISPVNVSRISQNLQTNSVIESLRGTQRDLFRVQAQIASGRSFLAPSDDPVRAARVLDLTQSLRRQQQFVSNVQQGDSFLAAADSSMSEISGLLIEASVLASSMVSNLTSEAEREATAEVVASIRNQLQIVGNREFNGRFIFGGRNVTDQPFVDALGGVAYVGDLGEMFTRISENLFTAVNVPGSRAFDALSDQIASGVDLTPVLTGDVRLEDISGAVGGAISTGVLVLNESSGAGVFKADLSKADTIGDVADAITAAATVAGSTLTAEVTDTGLTITPGSSDVTVTDQSNGAVASDLGILTKDATSAAIAGLALTPRITRLTAVDALKNGAGIDLDNGFIITNGADPVTVDISDAKTVQDIINAINNSGTFVMARVSDDGTRIDVFNTVSGTSLTIGENDGATATDLGIRTFDTATPLSSLNFGDGVTTRDGLMDLQVVAKDGTAVDVNLDGAVTVGDVLTKINEAATDAGVGVKASFATVGNGIIIEDSTGGAGDLSVNFADTSEAAIDLGIFSQTTGTDTTLVGGDVNPTRTDGIIGALIDLEAALRNDDTQGITKAGARLEELRAEIIRVRGVIGARSQAMESKRIQLQDASSTAEIFLSEVQDLDFAEAITRMQATLTQSQATMRTTPLIMNLSLMDFLR